MSPPDTLFEPPANEKVQRPVADRAAIFTSFHINRHERQQARAQDEVSPNSAAGHVADGSFRASPTSIRPLYTGGPVLLTRDGDWLISTMGEEVVVTEVRTGRGVARVKGVSFSVVYLANGRTRRTSRRSRSRTTPRRRRSSRATSRTRSATTRCPRRSRRSR